MGWILGEREIDRFMRDDGVDFGTVLSLYGYHVTSE